MSSVILDALESENSIGNSLKRLFEEKDEDFSYFKIKDMNILPCRSCSACAYKTPGECAFADEMPEIMRAVAQSSLIILLTPIRFGGYSSHLKKVIDKFMLMGTPFYMVKDGHLLHPMRYGNKSLIGIGVVEENLKGQEENFRTLVARNALNMQFTHRTLIFNSSDDITKIEHEISNMLKEVNQK